MDAQLFCRECGADHDDPADARLGHLVICLDCALAAEADAERAAGGEVNVPRAA
jgi:hypothetical protein